MDAATFQISRQAVAGQVGGSQGAVRQVNARQQWKMPQQVGCHMLQIPIERLEIRTFNELLQLRYIGHVGLLDLWVMLIDHRFVPGLT